jgi:cysteine synthase B
MNKNQLSPPEAGGVRLGGCILDRIGNTPLLDLSDMYAKEGSVDIYAKAEWFNPGGSVKDRPALRMVEEGERSGELTHDKIIIDSTSGNTGIAYAMIGAAKGYRVSLVIPENANIERKKILDLYGADIIFSSPFEGSDGALRLCRKIYEGEPEKYFLPGQYENPNNWKAHYHTTGPEIVKQTGGGVTHFMAGLGTSGTAMGTGRYLKKYNPDIRIIGIEPDNAMHGIEGLKHMDSSLKPGIYDPSILDETCFVSTEDAYNMAHNLAKKRGLLVGHSSGAAMCAALKLAEQIREGVIVTVLPDGGDRYLSMVLWEQQKRTETYTI